ncbi:ABC-type dipeptide/oligopeptide/nickel transport system ATPase component [Leucobacter luti]|uniref:ABC transporter ATP-binding protein n=1 Tax=Leucobacter luti TaxID=340320 RepID=UPI001047DD0F|nr:ABC transporter ATP-binding protein [Leucobacter luti]MCW2289491.1 ABC-type dipeptide/oligopeptide/nickel transport system ATPase component [Leucobacter luti]TCK33898.1 ABC-type dipeptide/oligopeptide/nickel transport system ATPase component [Leucobacter luti]
MLLELTDLHLSFSSPAGPVPVLRGISLAVGPGELVGLVGESGSGKSTTVRAALRLYGDEATLAGSAVIDGTEMIGAGPETLRRVRAVDTALIQQDPRAALNPVRRIGDSLTERLVRVHGRPQGEANATVRELLAAVGLSQPERRMRQYPHELSGGMLQRVVIAGALSTQPKLILADEATSALDVTTQAEVIAIMQRQIRERGLGVLFITHDLHLAAAICDRVHVLQRGEIVESLAGQRLFEDAAHEYTRSLIDAAPTMTRRAQP